MIGLKFRPSVCDLVDIRGLPKDYFQNLSSHRLLIIIKSKFLKTIKHCGNENESLIITDNPCLPHVCVQILGNHRKTDSENLKHLYRNETWFSVCKK